MKKEPDIAPELLLVEVSTDHQGIPIDRIIDPLTPCRITAHSDCAAALEHLLNNGSPLPKATVVESRSSRFNVLGFITRLRRSKRTHLMPVVIMVGNEDAEEITECYRAGANSCVTKPDHRREYLNHLALIIHYWSTVDQGRGSKRRGQPSERLTSATKPAC